MTLKNQVQAQKSCPSQINIEIMENPCGSDERQENIEKKSSNSDSDSDKKEIKLVKNVSDEKLASQNPKVSKNNLEEQQNSTQSSFITILAIFNTMVGVSVLVLPINFKNCGVVLSTLIMIFIGLISFQTCSWVIKNTGKQNNTFQAIIQRVLGPFWLKLFSFASFLIMATVGIVFFLLINSSLYQIVQFFFLKFNIKTAKSDEIRFDMVSLQWQGIILMMVIAPLYFVKKISFLLRLSKYGAIAIYIYIGFIIYNFVDNLENGNIKANSDDMTFFSTDFSYINFILGNFALSFMIHNVIPGIISQNKDKSKNLRDVKTGYILVGIAYGSVGVLGAYGILGRDSFVDDPQTLYDYLDPTDFIACLLAIIFFLQQFTVLPLFGYFSKRDFYSFIQSVKESKKQKNNDLKTLNKNENQVENNQLDQQQLQTVATLADATTAQNVEKQQQKNSDNLPFKFEICYNIVYISLQLLFQIFLINPNYIMSIAGSIIGFLIVYVIPFALRLKGDYEYVAEIKSDKKMSVLENQYNQNKKNQNNNNNQPLNSQQSLMYKTETDSNDQNQNKKIKIIKDTNNLQSIRTFEDLEIEMEIEKINLQNDEEKNVTNQQNKLKEKVRYSIMQFEKINLKQENKINNYNKIYFGFILGIGFFLSMLSIVQLIIPAE